MIELTFKALTAKEFDNLVSDKPTEDYFLPYAIPHRAETSVCKTTRPPIQMSLPQLLWFYLPHKQIEGKYVIEEIIKHLVFCPRKDIRFKIDDFNIPETLEPPASIDDYPLCIDTDMLSTFRYSETCPMDYLHLVTRMIATINKDEFLCNKCDDNEFCPYVHILGVYIHDRQIHKIL